MLGVGGGFLSGHPEPRQLRRLTVPSVYSRVDTVPCSSAWGPQDVSAQTQPPRGLFSCALMTRCRHPRRARATLQVHRFGSEMAALDAELLTAQSSEGSRPQADQDEVSCTCELLGVGWVIEAGCVPGAQVLVCLRPYVAAVPAVVSEFDSSFLARFPRRGLESKSYVGSRMLRLEFDVVHAMTFLAAYCSRGNLTRPFAEG